MKFKVGDRCKVKYLRSREAEKANGGIVTITKTFENICNGKMMGAYDTNSPDFGGIWEDELELVDNQNYIITDISPDQMEFNNSLPKFADEQFIRDYKTYIKITNLNNKFNEPQAQRKGFMTSIVDKIKNLALSATDRVLRKHNFEDENGKMTDLAREMMTQEAQEALWATRREAVSADLTKLDEEK
jgi:hypothetical protein